MKATRCLFFQDSCSLGLLANDFWGLVPEVIRANVSFGASFALKSLVSSKPIQSVSGGTQAKLFLSPGRLIEQVRWGGIFSEMLIRLCSECAPRATELLC